MFERLTVNELSAMTGLIPPVLYRVWVGCP